MLSYKVGCWHILKYFCNRLWICQNIRRFKSLKTVLIQVPKLSETEPIKFWTIKYQTYQKTNFPDTTVITYRIYQIQNFVDTKLLRYRSYHIKNLLDNKLISYWTWQLLNFLLPLLEETNLTWKELASGAAKGGGEGTWIYLSGPRFSIGRARRGWWPFRAGGEDVTGVDLFCR